MTPKSWFIMSQNIRKVVLHNILLQKKQAEILIFFRFYGHFGGHFEFDLQRSPEVTPILFAMNFENTLPIPNTMPN